MQMVRWVMAFSFCALLGANQSLSQNAVSKKVNYPCPTNTLYQEGKTIVFYDEFSDSLVNFNNWNAFNGVIDSWDPTSLMYLTGTTKNLYIDSGILVIAAINDTIENKDYSSAWIYTKAIDYGYFEIKCQVPKGACMWPAFWLTKPFGPGDGTYQEIDVFELDTDRGNQFQTNVWRGTDDTRLQDNLWIKPKKKTGFLWFAKRLELGDDYFIYGIDWQPDFIKFYLNNTLVRTVKNDIPNSPLSLHLDLWLGGHFTDEDCNDRIEKTDFPKYMKVDYVRVYKNKGNVIKIKGPDIICNETPISVEYFTQAQYIWTVPDGVYYTNGANPNEIIVSSNIEGPVVISANALFNDGSIEVASKTFWVTTVPPLIINDITIYPDYNLCNYFAVIDAIPNVDYYEWNLNITPESLITASPVLYNIPAGNTIISVKGVNCFGESLTYTTTQYLNHLQGPCDFFNKKQNDLADPVTILIDGKKITIYLEHQVYQKECVVEIFNTLGQRVSIDKMSNDNITININQAGAYICKISTENEIYTKMFSVK